VTVNAYRLQDLPQRVGTVLGVSDWVEIDQARIDAFAAVTGDDQWIHVDPVRAKDGPYGTTVAHGYLTLSLLPLFAATAIAFTDQRAGINYGLNRVRFPAPVPVGSRLRGRFELLSCEPVDGGLQLTLRVTVEREGTDVPVCVAEALSRRYGPVGATAGAVRGSER
jgi:acyl dehydratase